MRQRRSIPSAGLSMMDLISNALAGVIILFFILSSTKFPSIPPERVCGTLIVEFEMQKADPFDFSKVWVQYNCSHDREFKEDTFNRPSFDSTISQLNYDIQNYAAFSHCTSDTSSKQDTINPTPAINAYQIFDNSKTKHVIVMHDPPQGDWDFGLLYTDHYKILEKPQNDSVLLSFAWYSEEELFSKHYAMNVIAPTSRVGIHFFFEQKKIVKDRTYPTQSIPK